MPTHRLRFLPFLSVPTLVVLLDGAWAQSQATTGVIRGSVWDQVWQSHRQRHRRAQGNPHQLRAHPYLVRFRAIHRDLVAPRLLRRDGTGGRTGRSAADRGASARRRDRGINRQNAAADGGNGRRGGLIDGGYNPERTSHAPARRGRAGPAQQRAQLPQPDAVDTGGGHRPRPRRRRAEHWRPARHSQQHLGGWCRFQQSLLRRAARRPAPGLHL